MKLTGKIKNASGILVADPMYIDNPNLCYKANVSGPLNVVISISTHRETIVFEGKKLTVSSTDLDMILARGKLISLRKRDNALLYPPKLETLSMPIGVDTARLYVGTPGGYSEEYALLTGGDGQLGEVMEFSLPGKAGAIHIFPGEAPVSGWYGTAIRLSFPSDVIAENELLQSLVTQFHVEDIKNIGQ